MKRIGIDARFFGTLGKGLGRYTQKLIENLEKIDCENTYYIFLCKENFEEYNPGNPNFHKVLADYRWYTFAEQLFFPFLLFRYRLDLMHFPHFNVPILYRKKIIITIHDLILLHFPTIKSTTLSPIFYWIKFLAYKLSISNAIYHSSKIMTISEFTKSDILDNYAVASEKIQVSYEACDDFCYLSGENDDAILQKYGIIKPYLLYVGNAYPHKNLERLVEAFSLLQKEKSSLKLVLVGKHDYFYQRIKEHVADLAVGGVLLPGFIPDDELDVLYKHAEVYVFPSLYEGFGLPPLEAMSKGAPVVCSDHACMQEILDDSALFVDARKAEFIREGVLEVMNNQVVRENLIAKGYVQVRKYDWKKMAKDTLIQYQKS
jgi:glycosyltransferase involved in cell wall biosynthesis